MYTVDVDSSYVGPQYLTFLSFQTKFACIMSILQTLNF